MELPPLNLLVLLISPYEFTIRSCFEIRPDLSFPNALEPEKASSSSLNDLLLIRGLFAEALRVHIKWIHFRTRALTLIKSKLLSYYSLFLPLLLIPLLFRWVVADQRTISLTFSHYETPRICLYIEESYNSADIKRIFLRHRHRRDAQTEKE